MRRKVIAGLTALLAALAGRGSPPAAQPDPGRGADSPQERERPLHLEGYDPAIPALEAYRDWPPQALLQRFYGLPWSRMAFRRAELFSYPVFFVLTVGWNRGSRRLTEEILTDPDVTGVLNQGYISVVVNADLRPDIRERYQTGAWPAMALLLPDGKPILSQANDFGRAQPITTSTLDKETLLFILREGSLYWKKWPGLLMNVGDRWTEQEGPDPPEPGPVAESSSELMARWLLGNADREEGGFGAAPKFLVAGLDEYAALREARGLPALHRHSRLTLEKLIESPLFDGREGGLHRLAAAVSFGEIQYEKLLVGNAALLRELTWSLRGADSAEMSDALRKTAAFVQRTLGRREGGFYLAQSADPDSADGGGYWRSGGSGEAPPVDALVLAGPNAMAGAALLRAGTLMGDELMCAAGERALELVYDRSYRPSRGALHAIEPAGDERIYLATQADVALGFLDAHETTGRRRYLEAAKDIVEFATINLKERDEATCRDHLPDAFPVGLLVNERRPLRANVRLARAMIRLGWHGAGEEYRGRALALLERFSGDLASFGVHGVEAALAIEEAIRDPLRIRISGVPEDAATGALRRAAVNHPWPWTVVLTGPADGPARAEVMRGEESRQANDVRELADASAALTVEEAP